MELLLRRPESPHYWNFPHQKPESNYDLPTDLSPFLDDFCQISRIANLLRKNTLFLWTSDHEQNLRSCITDLASATLLHCPDFAKPFIIMTDASNSALGAFLFQLSDDDSPLPLEFASRRITTGRRMNEKL
eukprot:GHVP01014793.1.p2 GENE.GHVP01014793.1~~GHVP01014793.1.p2  ORF type:complete len:131 (-),score=8.24 GHVP01014793.1:326-718(-)